jgi:peptide/nickel transport system substrate-binding protein
MTLRAFLKDAVPKRAALPLVAIAMVVALAGCGGSAGAPKSSTDLTFLGDTTGPNVPGFSPFSTTGNPFSQGVLSLVYEPLLMFNLVHPSQVHPWLAARYSWSDSGKTLTFTIPPGRKWSDGTPMTAADVAFTFNLIKKFPALNVNGVVFKGASAPSATKAVLTFAAPAYAELFDISQVFIVPQHIWAKIPDPATYTDVKPVGTGPYLLQSLTAQQMVFTKNPHYWQAGLPKVTRVNVPQFTSANSALEALSSGEFDWAELYMTDPKKQWLSVDPQHNKLWLPPVGDYYLCPNTQAAPLNNPAVRRALELTFDRQRDVTEVEHGFYAPSTNPTGLRPGGSETQDMPAAYASKSLTYDPSLARKEFIASGMKAGSGGYLTLPDGKPFALALTLPSSYPDWMAMGQLMVNQMRAAGIDATLDGVALSAQTTDLVDGHYQLSFCGDYASNGAYTTFNGLLNGSLTAPIGKNAVSNFVRWNDPATNSALAVYRSTASVARQNAAMKKVATIVAKQAPIIPLMTVGTFGQYSTKRFTGFPSPSDPYQSDGINGDTMEDVIIHLKPVS